MMAMFLVDMVVIKYDMILCWSHTLVHSRKIYSTSNFRFIQKLKNCNLSLYYNKSYITKD